jgi:hypothetical protein
MPFLFGFRKPPQHVLPHPNSIQPGLLQGTDYSLPVLGIFVRYRLIVGLEMNRSILQICNLHQRSLLRFIVSSISGQADHSRISRTMRFFAFPDAALNMVRIA